MNTSAARGGVCLAAVCLLSACASHRPPAAAPGGAAAPGQQAPAPKESLTRLIEKVRALSQEARPTPRVGAQTVESWSPALAAALVEVGVVPSAEAHRHVASEYRRLGILDLAYQHLTEALRLDPKDAAAYDGLARIWRDWGFPHLGLADALRAVRLAPSSPEAANTVGTLFQTMGQPQSARAWYERALSIEMAAPYALNNLCYTEIVLRKADAVNTCGRAVAAAPGSKPALNNLALAYAARGDLEQAQKYFAQVGQAAAHYNMGIVYLSTRHYASAVSSFDAALRADPDYPQAARRARQARELEARQQK